jgi:hypothetical protein
MAVENALGRSLPGVWVQPQGAVVPKEAGFSFTVIPVGYTGSISGVPQRRLAALAGKLVADVSVDFLLSVFIPQIVYKTELAKLSLSSSFYLPIDHRNVDGSTRLISAFAPCKTFNNRGLADVWFSPLTVGIHFSADNNLAIDMKIFAPTGGYEPGDLSNLGMNAWTIQPNVAHTYLWKKRGLEVDNYVGFDIYSQNQTIRYTSGAIFHWDGMLFQYLSSRGGIGAILSNVTQINKDRGPLADQLNGFQGGAWGAGPIVVWAVREKDPGLALQFRWISQFGVTNMLKGNTLMLGLTYRK